MYLAWDMKAACLLQLVYLWLKVEFSMPRRSPTYILAHSHCAFVYQSLCISSTNSIVYFTWPFSFSSLHLSSASRAISGKCRDRRVREYMCEIYVLWSCKFTKQIRIDTRHKTNENTNDHYTLRWYNLEKNICELDEDDLWISFVTLKFQWDAKLYLAFDGLEVLKEFQSFPKIPYTLRFSLETSSHLSQATSLQWPWMIEYEGEAVH